MISEPSAIARLELRLGTSMFEQMPGAVLVAEAPAGRIVYANRTHEVLFGKPTDGARTIADFKPRVALHADGRPYEKDDWPIARTIATGEVIHGEEMQILREGAPTFVRVSSSPIKDESGAIVAAIAFGQDITGERKAATAFIEQNRVNEALLDIAAALARELDLDALVGALTDYATKLCRAQFGAFFYNVTDESGESYMLYALSGVDRSHFANFPMPRKTAVFKPTFEGTDVVRLADVTKDPRHGKNAPYFGMPKGHLPVRSYLAVPVKSRSGEVLGGLFFGHAEPDVFREEDERFIVAVSAHAAIAIENAKLFQAVRRAEAFAQEERQKFHDLFMQSPAAILLLRGPDHECEFVNDMAARILGGRDVIGKPLGEVLPNLSAERRAVLERVFERGERHVENGVVYVRDWNHDGDTHERIFNVIYEPYRGRDGNVHGVMTFGFDVTDQVEAKRRSEAIAIALETANSAKDEFLATVSHELRTPLNAILGWVRMLRSGTLPPDKHARAFEVIERNSNAQVQLVEDLLDVSRIISGKLRLEVGPVDLPNVIENAAEAVRPAAQVKEITIHTTLDPDAGPIVGDANRLQQVAWNLLANAVKFTPKGGRITIAVRRHKSAVDVIVADNGDGIDPEFLPYVFERFRQADASPTRKWGGLGLGLAIVRHLVELHGGTVRVSSDGLGHGATFTVSLPLSPLRKTPFERPPAIRVMRDVDAECPKELDGLHVLVVDDEPDARELLREVLVSCKARVTLAASAADALRLVQEVHPDIVVSDIGMPVEDGYALIKRLRALPESAGGRTPAVALTAYARFEDRTRALVAGFNMHVPKPVEPTELLAILTNLTTLLPSAARP